MQKNKSFQKPNKFPKQIHNMSSKVLLELSQITTHSKEKSNRNKNIIDRSGIHVLGNIENTTQQHSSKKQIKQNTKPLNRKQSYVKKNISLSSTVLKEIMQMSGSLPINNNNNGVASTRLKQSDNELIILSRKDAQRCKGNSQTNNSRKLLLYENKQNQQRVMSKSKSSYGQALKGEGMLCCIKIHPMDDQKGATTSHLSSTQKRDSFDARRSSFSSRRSSITLYPQDDFSAESKIRQIKKSFLAKFSGEDNNDIGQIRQIINSQSFLKKSQQNFIQSRIEEKKPIISRQTCPNDTEISPHEKKQIREKHLFKLDELNIIEQDIKKDALKFITSWDALLQSQSNLNKYQQYFSDTKTRYQNLQNRESILKNQLFDENKRYIMKKRMLSTNENVQKQNILLEAEKNHTETKKKVFKKDLEDMMIFNMRVVLPSSQMLESSVSCFNNHSNSALSLTNMTILQLYEELINQRACKKYGMILKKEINNMNIYDSRTMNDYLRRLYELELSFHRVQTDDSESQYAYLDRIESLVGKIDGISKEVQSVRQKYNEVSRKIKENERVKQGSRAEIESLINEISESIFSDYKLFQTGGKLQTPTKQIAENEQINQSFCQNDKTIEQFKDLVTKKYQGLYLRYKQIKEEKRLIEQLLRSYE